MSTLRNVHLKPAQPEPDQTARLPRLRFVTNDPAREYAARPGEVERLSDECAALILCRHEFRKVGRNGITIEGRTYWSENSVTIATKAGTNEKVLVTYNRELLDVIHVLTPDGKWVESIPLDGKAEILNPKDFNILAAKTRANNRRMERMAHLHRTDSKEALDRATHNEAQLRAGEAALHGVHTYPVRDRSRIAGASSMARDGSKRIPNEQPIADRTNLSGGVESRHAGMLGSAARSPAGALPQRDSGSSAPSAQQFPTAARIHEIQREVSARRQKEDDVQAIRRSAARFGAAAERSAASATSAAQSEPDQEEIITEETW